MIQEHTIRKALFLGDYSQFTASSSDFVLNVFSIFSEHPTSPFARLSILQLLKDRDASKDDPEQAYLEVREIVAYLDVIGMSPTAIKKHLGKLLNYRCIEPYDPTVTELADDTKVKITNSGLIHIEFAVGDHTYLEHVGLTTEVRENTKVDELRQIFNSGTLGQADWREATHLFAEYCIDQDLAFFVMPERYTGQIQVRDEFCKRWDVVA